MRSQRVTACPHIGFPSLNTVLTSTLLHVPCARLARHLMHVLLFFGVSTAVLAFAPTLCATTLPPPTYASMTFRLPAASVVSSDEFGHFLISSPYFVLLLFLLSWHLITGMIHVWNLDYLKTHISIVPSPLSLICLDYWYLFTFFSCSLRALSCISLKASRLELSLSCGTHSLPWKFKIWWKFIRAKKTYPRRRKSTLLTLTKPRFEIQKFTTYRSDNYFVLRVLNFPVFILVIASPSLRHVKICNIIFCLKLGLRSTFCNFLSVQIFSVFVSLFCRSNFWSVQKFSVFALLTCRSKFRIFWSVQIFSVFSVQIVFGLFNHLNYFSNSQFSDFVFTISRQQQYFEIKIKFIVAILLHPSSVFNAKSFSSNVKGDGPASKKELSTLKTYLKSLNKSDSEAIQNAREIVGSLKSMDDDYFEKSMFGFNSQDSKQVDLPISAVKSQLYLFSLPSSQQNFKCHRYIGDLNEILSDTKCFQNVSSNAVVLTYAFMPHQLLKTTFNVRDFFHLSLNVYKKKINLTSISLAPLVALIDELQPFSTFAFDSTETQCRLETSRICTLSATHPAAKTHRKSKHLTSSQTSCCSLSILVCPSKIPRGKQLKRRKKYNGAMFYLLIVGSPKQWRRKHHSHRKKRVQPRSDQSQSPTSEFRRSAQNRSRQRTIIRDNTIIRLQQHLLTSLRIVATVGHAHHKFAVPVSMRDTET